MTPSAVLFLALAAFTLTPWASPPVALVLGLMFALLLPHPWPKPAKSASKTLLQAGVVGLGFGMDLPRVLSTGAAGLGYTAGGIVLTLAAGAALGRVLRVPDTTAALISTGTAVCGGSAIAAVGPVLGADDEEMSVSLAAVFLLNAAALLLFPPIGHALSLTQEQFGLWAALAIHDTSSVAGATLKYGAAALAVGATVKLARALWIVPLTFAAAAWRRSEAKTAWPWFIAFFLLAAALNSYAPSPLWAWGRMAGRAALTATLFLIGAGVSAASLRKVGPRPLLLAVALWLASASASLALIRAGIIR